MKWPVVITLIILLTLFLANVTPSGPEGRDYHYNIHSSKRKVEEVRYKNCFTTKSGTSLFNLSL